VTARTWDPQPLADRLTGVPPGFNDPSKQVLTLSSVGSFPVLTFQMTTTAFAGSEHVA
jgi:hypothetical protein